MATSRPRGFAEWNPKDNTRLLVESVQDVLTEYEDIKPLTLRQIFYILVTSIGYDKTEQAYSRLTEAMNRARRAGMIEMEDIRDDGFKEETSDGWESRDHFLRSIRYSAEEFQLDRQAGQPQFIALWCEAQGMMPQLANAVEEWQIPVYSSGGFDSVTTKHDIAEKLSNHSRVEIFHIGDRDPSGVHLFQSLREDIQAFADYYGGEIELTRLAVTESQVAAMGLPTAPAKKSDNRSFSGLTTQAEAIPPRELRRIVREQIEEIIDHDTLQDVMQEEDSIRDRLVDTLDNIDWD